MSIDPVFLEYALAGVDLQDEGGVKHGEYQVEGQGHEEELPNLQPLQMKEAFTERVFEQVIVPSLYKGDEHGALPPDLIRNEDLVVQLDLTVNVVDVVLSQGDGVI